ncbi:MAG: Acylamidase [Chlamydiae bacterium]|nr:Acylamidase [Chlamydiota bacterium]
MSSPSAKLKELSTLPAYRIRELIRQKKVSPVEVTDFFLKRISKLNPELNALLYVNADNAKAYAAKREAMAQKGDFSKSLLGIPLVVSDVLNMKGIPTTFGSVLLKDNIVDEDHYEISLLKDAGAIILGKTNMAEFRLSFTTENRLTGPCRHPDFPKYSPGGGSAGGGVAVEGGLAPLAISIDMGGSLRVNSSCCGLIGLTPTRGRVPNVRSHLLPFSEKMFYRKGIIARDVRDVAMVLDVLAQPDARDPLCCKTKSEQFEESVQSKQKEMKVAWCPKFHFLELDPEVSEVTTKAAKMLETLGHHVEEYQPKLSRDFVQHFLNIIGVDRYLLIMNLLNRKDQEPSILMDYSQEFLLHGDQITGGQYSLAVTYSDWMENAVNSLFETYDLLVLPTMTDLPYPVDEISLHECTLHDKDFRKIYGHTCLFNMSGHPALTIPCGRSKTGLPIGLQLVGPHFSEGRLLSVANDLLAQ